MAFASVADSVAMVEVLVALSVATVVALRLTPVGAAVSIDTDRPDDADDVLPAASVALSVTMLPASAVPLKVGVSSLVMLSLPDEPLSVPLVKSGVDGALGSEVSSV